MRLIATLVLLLLPNVTLARDINVLLVDETMDSSNIFLYSYFNKGFSLSPMPGMHGNAMAMLILHDGFDNKLEPKDSLCPEVKIDSCDAFKHGFSYFYCLTVAARGNYDVVNMSLSGTRESILEKLLIKRIVEKSKVVVAAGNERMHISNNFPAGHKIESNNFYVVGDRNFPDSAYGEKVLSVNGVDQLTLDQNGELTLVTGTSASAARFSHLLLRRLCEQLYAD